MTDRLTQVSALISLGIMLSFAPPSAIAADGRNTGETAVELWQNEPETIFDARDVKIEDFKWLARPVIIFADAPLDPAFSQQMELLEARLTELTKRDVVLIRDTSPDERTDLRLTLRPRGFMLTVMGKDGRVILRKPFPWNVREISRQIDNLPIRQQEIRDALTADQ